jgi:ABC-type branched-subunit amino acid transport system ATPase component
VSVNILVVEGVLLTAVLLIDPEGLAGIVTSTARRLSPRLPGVALAEAALSGATAVPAAEAALSEAEAAGSAGGTGAVTPTADGSAALLRVTGVGKEYGGLAVLEDVSLALPGRGLFGLCGPNGAGKSTLLNVIGGSVPPARGTVTLNGADITRRPPHERFYLGISRTFQSVHLIKGRTVLDNVAVACLASHKSSIVTRITRSRLAEARARAAAALVDLDLRDIQDREVSSLTLEAQRMVELARAMAPGPSLLLLDEPASGLSEEQRQRLAATLTQLAQRTCVLLVEHDLDLVAQVSEQILVLSEGRLVFQGGPEEFRASPIVTSLLVGL